MGKQSTIEFNWIDSCSIVEGWLGKKNTKLNGNIWWVLWFSLKYSIYVNYASDNGVDWNTTFCAFQMLRNKYTKNLHILDIDDFFQILLFVKIRFHSIRLNWIIGKIHYRLEHFF